jgi:hypothetical protein
MSRLPTSPTIDTARLHRNRLIVLIGNSSGNVT